MSTLIRNGTIVTASDSYDADVYVDAGVISLIGRGLNIPADHVVDASGLLVMPGGVDVHTHLDLPAGGTTSADDFESGTIAAAFGGTTTIVDFATPEPGEGLLRGFDAWMQRAEGRAVVDYGFHLAMRAFTDQTAGEMDRLVKHHGVTSFKLYMAYPGSMMVDDAAIFRALRQTGENGGLVCLHAENGSVIDVLVREALRQGHTGPKYHALTRPTRAEGEATARAIALAEIAGAPVYIVHMTCEDALRHVREARDRGVPVFAETCPQYLFLSDEEYDREGFDAAKFVMSPPLRAKWNQDHLWRGLAQGHLQVVATDHCPFAFEHPPQKQLGADDFSKIPNGAPGIETRLMLLWTAVRDGRLSPQQFVDITSTAPAKLFGLWPRKGALAPGSDADLVLWNPEAEVTLSAATHHMRVDYNPYEGRMVRGAPAFVLSRGEVIVDHGTFTGRAGRGLYLKRGARARHLQG
jgi:dihydropyrimidinase